MEGHPDVGWDAAVTELGVRDTGTLFLNVNLVRRDVKWFVGRCSTEEAEHETGVTPFRQTIIYSGSGLSSRWRLCHFFVI